jgi:hypothetical protein
MDSVTQTLNPAFTPLKASNPRYADKIVADYERTLEAELALLQRGDARNRSPDVVVVMVSSIPLSPNEMTAAATAPAVKHEVRFEIEMLRLRMLMSHTSFQPNITWVCDHVMPVGYSHSYWYYLLFRSLTPLKAINRLIVETIGVDVYILADFDDMAEDGPYTVKNWVDDDVLVVPLTREVKLGTVLAFE